jgi:hypothetical protein
LQITGVSCYWECEHVMRQVEQWLSRVCCGEFRIVHSYIGMINSNFSVGHGIDLPQLNGILNAHETVMSIYNPESYPAINMKMNFDQATYMSSKSTLSIFIFGTGNIVITGCKSLPQVQRAYLFIVRTIRNHPSIVRKLTNHVLKPINHPTTNYVHGYPFRKLLSALSVYSN